MKESTPLYEPGRGGPTVGDRPQVPHQLRRDLVTLTSPPRSTMSDSKSLSTMPQTHKALVNQLTQSLAAFQTSPKRFEVICSLPWSRNIKPPYDNNGYEHEARSIEFANASGSEQAKRLVVLDSSFNPPTRAHAAMLRSALTSSPASTREPTRVLLLLAVKNADKAPQPAAFPSRLGMMTAFREELRTWDEGKNVDVDVGVTTEPYFHDKALAIRDSGLYGKQEQPESVFLAGFDTLIRVLNPKYYTQEGGIQAALDPFFKSSILTVTLRGDDDWGSADEQRAYVRSLREDGENGIVAKGGKKEWLERIELVDGVEGEAVSSSRARKAVKLNEDLYGMVGPEVKRWVMGEELYREE
ncbi:Nucleotidylyl transferase [Sarocladium strictum]